MALLALKDIGKIYVSDGNVAVGIRGVNLSFNKGEFVAITGKSGSGKSTLLNVISGMDTYEEGELFIDGQPTSHYLQPEWEEYREKYISFIFQDYNIIESFTVLQNVELALMHIEDKKERRKRALELIKRVGLYSHLKHKGSKLSGGQKQRTVIARALAKDSPIILADEPTGNLDSVTSKEIIDLLYEVSKDKLLIVVTHNFSEVEEKATRHIRIFDGAVESDKQMCPAKERTGTDCNTELKSELKATTVQDYNNPDKRNGIPHKIKNGFTLGSTIFKAKPKLSLFLCTLMIIGTLGIFVVTANSGDAAYLFEKHYMFNNIDGRVVITKQQGGTISNTELEQITKTVGAVSSLHYDALLDMGKNSDFYFDNNGEIQSESFICTYGEDFGNETLGSYPKSDDQVLLYLPISYQPDFGKSEIIINKIYFSGTEFEVSGIKYYYDNNKAPKCIFTENGFRIATAAYYMIYNSSINATVTMKSEHSDLQWSYYTVCPSFDAEKDKIHIDDKKFHSAISNHQKEDIQINISFSVSPSYDYNNEYYYDHSSGGMIIGSSASQGGSSFTKTISDQYISKNSKQSTFIDRGSYKKGEVIICPYLMTEIMEEQLESTYGQASLFFENKKQAHNAVDKLMDAGYIAVPADTTYTPDSFTTIGLMFAAVLTAIMWFMSIVFFAFVINLCSSRTLGAFKADMAIMRSMGIPVKVIRIGMYARMLISLIPAFVFLFLFSFFVYTVPKFNSMFTYLYWWQYAAIVAGMIILTLRLTRKQVKRLFGESVKKSLKGGNRE